MCRWSYTPPQVQVDIHYPRCRWTYTPSQVWVDIYTTPGAAASTFHARVEISTLATPGAASSDVESTEWRMLKVAWSANLGSLLRRPQPQVISSRLRTATTVFFDLSLLTVIILYTHG